MLVVAVVLLMHPGLLALVVQVAVAMVELMLLEMLDQQILVEAGVEEMVAAQAALAL